MLELHKQGSIDIEDAVESIHKGESLNAQAEDHLYFAFPSEQECTICKTLSLSMLMNRLTINRSKADTIAVFLVHFIFDEFV